MAIIFLLFLLFPSEFLPPLVIAPGPRLKTKGGDCGPLLFLNFSHPDMFTLTFR